MGSLSSVDQVSRRPVPGTRFQASVVGFRLEPSISGTPLSDRRSATVLGNARSRGVTTFAVGSGVGSLRAERWIRTAFPSVDPELLILVRRSTATLADEISERSGLPGHDLETRLRDSLARSAERLHPQPIGLLEWEPSENSDASLADELTALKHLKAEGVFADWVLSIPDGGTVSAGDDADRTDAHLFSGSFSPLDSRLLAPLAEKASRGPVGFFAQDPLGGGRLDGTRFAESVADRRPDARPLNVRELRREYEPVLRLGFLTERRGRTLAQASLRFVLRWPWVCTALVRLPSPERLEELLRTESTPSLTDAELEQTLQRPS